MTEEDDFKGRERRTNFELRERLDQLIEMARELSRTGSSMSREELDEARLRIEWLSEEIWTAAVYGPLEQREKKRTDTDEES
ncbi:MAG TPA: hypothetical protein VLC48_09460 [Gemmatimonadota bacterium]|nr:hypothetical protein [Gemmatimonadota bacterium]